MHMVHLQTGRSLPLPIHGSRDIGVGLIREILREAGISREEWNSL